MVLLLLALGLGSMPARPTGTLASNGILAVVGDDIITLQDIETDPQNQSQEAQSRKQYQGQQLTDKLKEARLQTLNRLIDERLIVQDFQRQGYFFSDAQIDSRIDTEIKTEYRGNKDLFHAALLACDETEDQYRSRVVDSDIVSYMTTMNVDKKVIPTSPDDEAKQRIALRQAWLDGLHARTYVKILSPPTP